MTQQQAIEKFLDDIETYGHNFEKFTQIKARPAQVGEFIETFTLDGKETQNYAKENDYVITNLGGSNEEYIMPETTLKKRYKHIEDDLYQSIGECRGIEYFGPEIVFKASWGQDMVLKNGDMIVTPLPQRNEVYRIAREEFNKTYRMID